jgi:hypothetical protein
MCALCDPTSQTLSDERPNIFAAPSAAPRVGDRPEPGGVFVATRPSSATIQRARSDAARHWMPPLAHRAATKGVVALAVASVLALIVVIARESDPQPAAGRRAIAPSRAERSVESTPGARERKVETRHGRVWTTAPRRRARRPHRSRPLTPTRDRPTMRAHTTAPADAPAAGSAPRPASPARPAAPPSASAAPRRPLPVPLAAPPEFM